MEMRIRVQTSTEVSTGHNEGDDDDGDETIPRIPSVILEFLRGYFRLIKSKKKSNSGYQSTVNSRKKVKTERNKYEFFCANQTPPLNFYY